MFKIVVTFGTRPEILKMIPVIEELKKYNDIIKLTIINTAQHRELVDEVMSMFHIEPQYDLDVMIENQHSLDIIVTTMDRLRKILQDVKPDLLLVQGDTNSACSSAMTSYHMGIDVGHVEAGLRTYNIDQPFPEEANRRIISIISRMHFAPTQSAKKQLISEKIDEKNIFVTGNTIIDMLYRINEERKVFSGDYLSDIDFAKHKVILVTVHRRENHGKVLLNIVIAIKKLVERFSELLFIIVIHPNPNVKKVLIDELNGDDRIILLDTLNYVDFVVLMKNCYFIMTDSGGIQEEAPSFQKPVLVLRNVTERPEGVEAGCSRVIGFDTEGIIKEVTFLLDSKVYSRRCCMTNPFGDGNAAKYIVDAILNKYHLT